MRPWKTLSETELFAAEPYVRVTREVVQLPDGKVVDDYHKVRLRSFCKVVPLTAEGRILMLRQYKHGPQRVGLSFPAGFLEPGEAPVHGAARELLEETGHRAERLVQLGQYVDHGNQRGAEGFHFLGTGCSWVQEPNPGDLEEMEIVSMTPAEVDAMMRDNELVVIHDVAAWGLARVLYPAVLGPVTIE